MESIPSTETYPRLLRRLQGVSIDSFLVPLAAMATLVAVTYAGVESTWIKVFCPLLVVLVLEPIAVSATGGTIGHHMMGLRIRKERVDERISILAAIVRLVVKTIFGLPAFFVAFITRRRQGMHDLAARSLVVHKSAVGLPDYEYVPARTHADEHATYASVWRRVLVIVLYWFLAYVLASLILAASLSGACLDAGRCSSTQLTIDSLSLVVLLVVFVAIAIMGWTGSLYGCRNPRSTGIR
ncbi:MAG: RDD family protein [Dokdonella sp.]